MAPGVGRLCTVSCLRLRRLFHRKCLSISHGTAMSDAPTKYYFRQRQRNRLYDAVIKAIEEAAARDHVRRKDIAEKLEIPPSLVTRLLSGPANWTSDTM